MTKRNNQPAVQRVFSPPRHNCRSLPLSLSIFVIAPYEIAVRLVYIVETRALKYRQAICQQWVASNQAARAVRFGPRDRSLAVGRGAQEAMRRSSVRRVTFQMMGKNSERNVIYGNNVGVRGGEAFSWYYTRRRFTAAAMFTRADPDLGETEIHRRFHVNYFSRMSKYNVIYTRCSRVLNIWQHLRHFKTLNS